MTALARPGGTCNVCGAPVDRRATHCRQHRVGAMTPESAREMVERKTAATRRQAWLLDMLASLPTGTIALVNPAALLAVLTEPLDDLPAIEHPAYAVYDVAAAYAVHQHPAADDSQRAGFAVVLHSAASGMSGPFEPPSSPDVEQGDDLVLALVGGQPARIAPERSTPGQIVGVTPPMTRDGQAIASLPPDAMARLVVLALEEAYFGDGYDSALREGMAALVSVQGVPATLARRSVLGLWRQRHGMPGR